MFRPCLSRERPGETLGVASPFRFLPLAAATVRRQAKPDRHRRRRAPSPTRSVCSGAGAVTWRGCLAVVWGVVAGQHAGAPAALSGGGSAATVGWRCGSFSPIVPHSLSLLELLRGPAGRVPDQAFRWPAAPAVSRPARGARWCTVLVPYPCGGSICLGGRGHGPGGLRPPPPPSSSGWGTAGVETRARRGAMEADVEGCSRSDLVSADQFEFVGCRRKWLWHRRPWCVVGLEWRGLSVSLPVCAVLGVWSSLRE